MALFNTVRRYLGDVNIIAEDLGDINDNVRDFLKESGFPGMKVLQFAFNPYFDDADLPHSYIRNLCAYTGTHDNDTTFGWITSAPEEERNYALEYAGYPVNGDWMGGGPESGVCRALIRTVWSSVAFFAAAPIQDFLGYGTDARMNVPGVPTGNWRFRVGPGVLEGWDVSWLKRMNIIYGRHSPYEEEIDRSLLTSSELEALLHKKQRKQSRKPVLEQLSKLDRSKGESSPSKDPS
jgi:4-alpha-glucanotransferase